MLTPSRAPAVSGTFYPALPARLRADVTSYLGTTRPVRRAAAVISPHAGLQYSGATAGAVFAAIDVPDTVIVLAPNHTGRAASIEGGSILLSRAYRTPLGDVAVDEALGEALVQRAAPLLEDDLIAHAQEHAVEVVLPFLQVRNPSVRVVPIVLWWSDWTRCALLGEAMADVVADRTDVLVVASSDLNHYESAAVTEEKDARVLDCLAALDGRALLELTSREGITMCGRVPAAAACAYVRARGGRGAEVLAHSHSGLVNGDFERVVGYGGMLLGIQ